MVYFPILRPDRLPQLPAVVSLLAAWAALTPSLLPRGAIIQGLLCGVSAILGYAIGSFLRWALHGVSVRIPSRLLAILAVVGTLVMLALARVWQQEQRADIGVPAAPLTDLFVVPLVAIAVFTLLLVISRTTRSLGRILGRTLGRFLPVRIGIAAGAALALWVAILLANSLVVGQIGGALDRVFLAINDEFSTDVAAPTISEVSAGPGSPITWEELGRQGRIFIANTPTAQAIGDFLGAEAQQPIRVYVGGGTAGGNIDLPRQADEAVAELIRTGAFDRSVLNVVTGTGRGWVNENSARSLEYLWSGDIATVSIQYSYQPSWMSYLVDSTRAQEAGRVLFDAVYSHWIELPESSRPKLVVSGESLGSFGGERAFSGAQDLAARTSGALWVGPTANNALWSLFTSERDTGSPIFLPVYEGGEIVRFSPDGDNWPGSGTWEYPRVGYLQHANDPITWFDFPLAYLYPEWLSGQRGPAVPERMIWIPGITMLQVAADQVAPGMPAGHGHEFGQAPARAWAQILPPDGWSATDTERLVEEMAALRLTDLGE